MTMAFHICVFVLYAAAAEANIGRHIYIDLNEDWLDAQEYCQTNYAGLSMVLSQADQDNLLVAAGTNDPEGWIGLTRDCKDVNSWIWATSGETPTYENWADSQPDNHEGNECSGQIFSDGTWNDRDSRDKISFYCFSINVVQTPMTWENALQHCRTQWTDLGSLVSREERLQAQSAIQDASITDPVWIGLRYLGDRWLWMNNDTMEFEEWNPNQPEDPQCPVKARCGALTKERMWVSVACEEELNFICI